tara:strand:- start:18668 stop:19129 length:462 start_codon:yes stop_codon:yes gene_type:complete
MENKITDKQRELVEKFGVIEEQMGIAPAPARVNALLTIADTPELTFDEIREALQLSKSATSNAINYLLTLDRIGYKTKPGDRKRYFYSKLNQWKASFRKSISGLDGYTNMIREIRENRTNDTVEFNEQLEELANFMDYFMTESIAIIDRWEQR